MYVLLIVVCPFVLFLLAIVLSVLLRYKDSDCPFGIFKNSSLKCELFDGNVTSHICQRCYLIEGLLLTRKLLDQWFLLVKLNSSLQKFYGMEYLCHKCPWIWFTCRKHFPVLSSFMAYHRVCNWINKTGVTSRVGTAYPFWTPELTPGFVLLDL